MIIFDVILGYCFENKLFDKYKNVIGRDDDFSYKFTDERRSVTLFFTCYYGLIVKMNDFM
jgi:hypothetical protein